MLAREKIKDFYNATWHKMWLAKLLNTSEPLWLISQRIPWRNLNTAKRKWRKLKWNFNHLTFLHLGASQDVLVIAEIKKNTVSWFVCIYISHSVCIWIFPLHRWCKCIKVSAAEFSVHFQPASQLAYQSWLPWSWMRLALPPDAWHAPPTMQWPTQPATDLGWTPPEPHSPGLGGSPASRMVIISNTLKHPSTRTCFPVNPQRAPSSACLWSPSLSL